MHIVHWTILKVERGFTLRSMPLIWSSANLARELFLVSVCCVGLHSILTDINQPFCTWKANYHWATYTSNFVPYPLIFWIRVSLWSSAGPKLTKSACFCLLNTGLKACTDHTHSLFISFIITSFSLVESVECLCVIYVFATMCISGSSGGQLSCSFPSYSFETASHTEPGTCHLLDSWMLIFLSPPP